MGIAIKISDISFEENKLSTIELIDIAELVSISATFNQGSNKIYANDSLETLKPFLIVNATYDDGSVKVVNNYTLSGFLNVGQSTITVLYKNKSATFKVNVSEPVVLNSISATYTQGETVVYPTTSLDSFRNDLIVTATYSDGNTRLVSDYELSGKLSIGTSTVTVSYQSKTTSFNVNVSEQPIEPEAKAYCNAVGITDDETKLMVNDFVATVKLTTVWNKIKAIYPMMGASLNQMKTNLKAVGTLPLVASTGEFLTDYGVKNTAITCPNTATQTELEANGLAITLLLNKEEMSQDTVQVDYLSAKSNGMSSGFIIIGYNKLISARSNVGNRVVSTEVDLSSMSDGGCVFTTTFTVGQPVDIFVNGAKPRYAGFSDPVALSASSGNFEIGCISGTNKYAGYTRFIVVSEALTEEEALVLSRAIHKLKPDVEY